MWVGGFFFWVVGLWPGSAFVVVLFAAGRSWLVLGFVCVIRVFRGFYQAWRSVSDGVVGSDLSHHNPLLVACSLPMVVAHDVQGVVAVWAVGGEIDGFLGIVFR